ncbi:tetratricopeptide repeat protein (macronuclear) [Tetrahymena thermophila SB210]|uniref:Tetratricopeptide repeat protein n=1 Tax=Tetrahymena thermophila (strain SB210) TaxID=312017 RepID=Q230Z3_TETTS|nr:tetratricopeptide repeat protein [Tetrahymena thermophila SB210]EAR91146.1 tetratricopeptide repeat protein [Tetrahymena thermophila SB210]|eukprot:XP_001011391.1 tetratricopeptide repeat protein [Tetrahymena thermophila SB210]
MIEDQVDQYVSQVVQQLNQIKDLEVTDIRKDKEGFGKYLFAKYQQNSCMIQIISVQNDEKLSQYKKLQIAIEKVNRLKQCSHKNIIRYYDSFQIEDSFFIVMEKVEFSLQQWINDNKKNLIQKEQFLKFALQMVEAADYLHQKKYILSNISLKNIFLDRDLNIKLSTFTVQQEVSVKYLLHKQIYALENDQLIYFPIFLIDKRDNQDLITLSSKQDMYTIGLCLYCLTGVSYMEVLNYIWGDKFQVSISLGVDVNQILQLMLFRNQCSFVPSPSYFIKSFQQIIESLNKQQKKNDDKSQGQAKFQMSKDEEVQYLKLFQEIATFVDNIKQEKEQLSEDEEGNQEIKSEVKEESQQIKSEDSNDVDIFIEKTRCLTQMNQNCDILYLFLGHLYEISQDFQQSLDSYKKAFALNDQNDAAVFGMGLAYGELGFIQESLNCYNKYINLNTLDDEVYNNIGDIYFNLNDYNTSKSYFKKSVEFNPRQHIAFYNLGQVYFQQNMFQKGSYYLKKAKKIELDDDTSELLGFFYKQKQDYEKSLKCYEKLSIKTQNYQQYKNLIHSIKSQI